jgi:hypothetical protein
LIQNKIIWVESGGEKEKGKGEGEEGGWGGGDGEEEKEEEGEGDLGNEESRIVVSVVHGQIYYDSIQQLLIAFQ